MDKKHGYQLSISGDDDRDDDNYDIAQLSIGMKVEKEHTNNVDVAKSIAKDHLDEIPDYYTRLIDMEKAAKTNSVESNVVTVLDLSSILAAINRGEDVEKNKKITVNFGHVYNNIMENPLVRLVAALGYLGNVGHSFEIVLDPGRETEITIDWDGDGVDYIKSIQCGDKIIQPKEFKKIFGGK